MRRQFITWLCVAFGFLILAALAIGVYIGLQNPPITHEVTVTLNVGAAPDFTLTVTPDTINTFVNRTVAYNVECDSVNQFAGDITLSVGGLPSGWAVEFWPSATFTIGPGSPKGAQLNITIPDDPAAVGTYQVKVTATSTTYN